MAVSLSALRAGRPLPPRKIPGSHFCQRRSRPQGHNAAGRIRSFKKNQKWFVTSTYFILRRPNSVAFFNYWYYRCTPYSERGDHLYRWISLLTFHPRPIDLSACVNTFNVDNVSKRFREWRRRLAKRASRFAKENVTRGRAVGLKATPMY
jgi:hypothetical protein